MAQSKRPKAALNLEKLRKIGVFLVRVRGIVTNFINNAAVIGTPSPTTTVVSGHIDDLQTAQDDVQTRVLGAATTRNLKKKVVLKDIFKWQNYIQDLADAAADVDTAINIISQSGFELKINGQFIKPDLRIKAQITPGVVKLYGKSAGKGASYNWQWSSNNQASWSEPVNSNVANLLVSGLTSKATYYFRFRSTVKGVTSAWCIAVPIVMQ